MADKRIIYIPGLPDAELEEHIVTLDGRGKEYKKACLEEILKRLENRLLESSYGDSEHLHNI